MFWSLQWVGRLKVRMLKEITTHFRGEKHHSRKNHPENNNRNQIFRSVIRVKGDSVQRYPIGAFMLLNFDAIRIKRTCLVQCENMDYHQHYQCKRHSRDMQGEESVQRDVRDKIIAPYPLDEALTNAGNSPEQ